MQSLGILLAAVALAASAPALAQSALRHLSGDLRLNSGLDLTYEAAVPFSATLTSRTGEVCLVMGKFDVERGAARKPRQLRLAPGPTFIRCPGSAPALVVGQLVPSAWEPPQWVRCRSHGLRGSCHGYAASVEAGASTMWITWHALTSDPAAKSKGARRD